MLNTPENHEDVHYPIKRGLHDDKRYKISREYTGDRVPMYVFRFCDEYVGCFRNIINAVRAAREYNRIRLVKALNEA